jgi:RNA polymerase sigma-70 factor (ECF subfamily)
MPAMPAMEPTASHILVARAQRRDSAAIAILFERYRDKLRLALRRRLGDQYRRALLDSEDAVQDGILAALGSLDQFEYRGSGSFLAWVLRVAEREVLQRVRAQQAQMRDRTRQVDLAEADDPTDRHASPSEIAAAHETEARIQQCLEQLGEREREVIVLRRYLDLDADEIRVEMKLPSPGAARALLSRAQARLALLLDTQARP